MSDSFHGRVLLVDVLEEARRSDCSDVISTVPLGTVSRLMGCSPYHAHDSTPLDSVSSTQIVTSTCLGS